MWETIVAWRGELFTTFAILGSALAFRGARKPFWKTWAAGVFLGLAIEIMTEPEWNYHMRFYFWRDISPFTVMGWGVTFSWVVELSDRLYSHWFKRQPGPDLRILLTDWLVGIPLVLGGELFGLYVLKVWNYSDILHWDTPMPWIPYPWEGFVALVLFVAVFPTMVRFWKYRRDE